MTNWLLNIQYSLLNKENKSINEYKNKIKEKAILNVIEKEN